MERPVSYRCVLRKVENAVCEMYRAKKLSLQVCLGEADVFLLKLCILDVFTSANSKFDTHILW